MTLETNMYRHIQALCIQPRDERHSSQTMYCSYSSIQPRVNDMQSRRSILYLPLHSHISTTTCFQLFTLYLQAHGNIYSYSRAKWLVLCLHVDMVVINILFARVRTQTLLKK